ncbi:hypothetical protein [uncultured Psychrosphaera sp.]|uniref:hypothetical protein n=1 Tax=uncultured Psychrosphaera sp. TaxID=1403522 RepID=UPI00260FBD02|nr:hypothetical protein [uncultured Psychrosphaera sp.]
MRNLKHLVVFFGVAVSLLLIWSLFRNDTSTFTLELHGFQNYDVKSVAVKGNDFTTSFIVAPEDWDPLVGLKLKVLSMSKTGLVEIRVNTINNGVLFLANVEFKVGETNYITENQGELKYVKAHWN